MKTDRFSDIIRRKLESIRPEFTEKDWVRMQATLHQAGMPQPGHTPTGHPFSGGVWSGGQSWLVAAASVSTAALIGVGIWQHNQISHLRETVAQLKQKATVIQTVPIPPATEPLIASQSNRAPAPGRTAEQVPTAMAHVPRDFTAPHSDTVYIDRYVTAPTLPYSGRILPGTEQKEAAQRRQNQSVTKNYAATDRLSAPSGSLRRQNQLTISPKTDSYGVSSTPLTSEKSNLNQSSSSQSVIADQPNYQPAHLDRISEKSTRNERYATAVPPTQEGRSEQAQSVSDLSTQTTQSAPVKQPDATGTVSATYESIASRPLSPQTVNWSVLLAQQAKRMRPAKVVIVTPSVASVVTKAPANKPEQRIVHTGIRFRAGLGGEIASHLLGAGVYTETLLGKHWLVGVGINQTTYSGRFVDENDFHDHIHRDFQAYFALKNDPNRNILNIDAQTTRIQIPLYFGYRIPLTASIAFLPTAGTYLNLTNAENATFYTQTVSNTYTPYNPVVLPPRPRVSYEEGIIRCTKSVELINSFAFGTGIEWQQKHWVVQASPVLTVPLQANMRSMQPESNWQQNITLGFRARLLYQF